MQRLAYGDNISAKTTSDQWEAVRCIASAIPESDVAPESIQLFPPGKHEITAAKNGEPSTMSFTINSSVADVIKRDFESIVAEANARKGPKPFIDFNHEDGEASGWVTDVYWAGDDPETGGVRAKIDWSKPGKEAVTGKAYRAFSPNFRVAKDTSEIVGVTPNMGGLVNRPAFRGIEAFFAKEAEGSQQQPKNNMEKLHKALVAAGLLSAIPTDDTVAAADFDSKWKAVQQKEGTLDAVQRASEAYKTRAEKAETDLASAKEKLTKAETDLVAAKASGSGNTTEMQRQIDDLKAKHKTLAEQHADSVIAKWVDGGVLPPKDEAGKTKWKALLVSDPSNESLMEPVIAAKAANGTRDITQRVVTVTNSNGGGTTQLTGKPEEQYVQLIKAKTSEIQTANSGMSVVAAKAKAVKEVNTIHGELYKAWRECPDAARPAF